MSRILIVKTSSLGDIVHALPVLDDVQRALPGAIVDWVAEEAFADLPRMHPAVRRAIPVAIRRWRRSLWAGATRGEIGRVDAELRGERYDFVVDLQGLAKSALIVARITGTRCGYDWQSAREPIASLAYDRRFRVAKALSAIARNRLLAAGALGYRITGAPSIRLALPAAPAGRDGRYVVFLHATSAAAKLWPEASWQALAEHFGRAGLGVVLPWGSPDEHARSQRIAGSRAAASVPPRQSLPDLAALLAGADLVIGVDTGLTHLAAAVGTGTVALFLASDPERTGVTSFGAPAINLGGAGRPPGLEAVIASAASVLAATPRC